MDLPSSWSLYFWTDAGNASKSGCDSDGRIRWFGMMDPSFLNQNSDSAVRSRPLSGIACG